MRIVEIWSEAARNVGAGTARAVSLCLVFICIIGLVAVLHAREVVGLSQRALEFQDSGAATFILDAPGAVAPDACNTLAASDGVTASGALRTLDGTRLALLPDRSIPTWETTQGMAEVLSISPAVTPNFGVWLSQPLATQLGLAVGDSLDAITTPGERGTSSMRIDAIFDYPADDRDQRFAESILIPTTSFQESDLCMASFWPEAKNAPAMLRLAAITPPGSDPASSNMQIEQLNRTLGSEFKPSMSWTPMYPLIAIITGLTAPLVILRSRRLEFASALHARVSKPALGILLSVEWLLWAVPAVLVASMAVLFAASIGNPDPLLPALVSGLQTLVAGTGASYLAMILLAVASRESHLFKLFRSR